MHVHVHVHVHVHGEEGRGGGGGGGGDGWRAWLRGDQGAERGARLGGMEIVEIRGAVVVKGVHILHVLRDACGARSRGCQLRAVRRMRLQSLQSGSR